MDDRRKIELVDFCNAELGTTVETNTSFNDAFPPTNLISSIRSVRSQGFLADYFIRPPVCLKFVFRHPIHLCKVQFQPRVGQQSCNIFEIWAWTVERITGEGFKIGRLAGDHLSDWCHFQNFYFPGHRFLSDRDADKSRLSPEHVLRNIKALEFKILRTDKSGVPCLKNLSIWGIPSERVSQDEVQKTKTAWADLLKTSLVKEGLVQTTLSNGLDEKNNAQKKKLDDTSTSAGHEVEVPTDFLDALTHVRMDVPMVLPCGQVIDRNTLDHYTQEEASWGRSPNDPFTAKLFSATSRGIMKRTNVRAEISTGVLLDRKRALYQLSFPKWPVFDANLKARIDSFVLGQHGISVSGLRKRRHDLIGVSAESETKNVASSSSAFEIAKVTSSNENTIKKKKSLDDCVTEALIGRKSIILSSAGSSSRLAIACNVCKSVQNLYQFQCLHLICRFCLDRECQKNVQHLCAVCQKEWLKKDVFKFHSVVS